jgi:hypothetical protein
MDLVEIFYDYVLPPTTIQALANLPTNIVINGDADFQAIWLIASSTGPFTCRFGDGATGRFFMSRPVNNVNLFGTALQPFPMLPPYVWKRQGSISLDLTDTSGAPNTIQIVFSGKKIFPTPISGAAGAIQQ